MKSVWRRAAELVTQEIKGTEGELNACCTALEIVAGSESIEARWFADIFKPAYISCFWWGYPDRENTEAETARVLALLLMEQIEADK
jgi:hypothetical protein